MADFFASAAAHASVLCYAAAALGCCYALFAAGAARAFVRSARVGAPRAPDVTILKPLHGIEPKLYKNLASFCDQRYAGQIQIVCGVASAADAAIAVVDRLAAVFPAIDVKLVVDPRSHGANRKISNLINMMPAARHDVMVICDSDIAVGPEYLKTVAAHLGEPGVGLVTCLYRGAAATGFWSRLAAAQIDYHFLPSVLVGLKLGLAAPCFGSTMALRRSTLAAIGGLEAVADRLADDYAIGDLVRRQGLA